MKHLPGFFAHTLIFSMAVPAEIDCTPALYALEHSR
jgi:hypothetical protein